MAPVSPSRLIQLAIAFGLLSTAAAQAGEINLARMEPGSRRLHLSLGLAPAVITTLGVSRGFGMRSRTALVNLELGVVSAELDVRDVRARLGLQTTVWQNGDWRIAARVELRHLGGDEEPVPSWWAKSRSVYRSDLSREPVMHAEQPSRTARKVALNILALDARAGMEDVLPFGIVDATAKLPGPLDVERGSRSGSSCNQP
jgi:hypothetical protein